MAKNNSSQSPGPAGEFVAADAQLRQLQLAAHLIFLLLMFLLPALFGRYLFLRFTLPTPLIPTAMVLGWCLALIFKWRKNTWPCIVAKFLLLGVQSVIYLSGMVKPH